MLVLTRKVGTKLIINENIIITIKNVRGSSVSVSIDAPKENRILRGELVGKDRAA